MASCRRECTDRLLTASEQHLATVPDASTQHYNQHRPHRSLGQRPPTPPGHTTPAPNGTVRRRAFPGGLINEYRNAAGPPAKPPRRASDPLLATATPSPS
ncbi:MAG: integrase core domain-containing protein [Micromonosporaceae bacterium]